MTILFIGAINKGNKPKGGEEFKNQILLEFLSKSENIRIFDTYRWKTKPLLILKMLITLFFGSYQSALISASSLSTFRLLQFTKNFKYIQKRFIYAVIGGYLPEGIRNNIYHISAYRNLKHIIVEGVQLQKSLLELGLKPVSVIPNFKNFPQNLAEQLPLSGNEPKTKFVFVSRIEKEKGILLIQQACKILQHEGLSDQFEITYYGPVQKDFEMSFITSIGKNEKYGGFLDFISQPESAYFELSHYHVMLFPTFWVGEGFPGVLIDAFVAGLPVIASKWNMNESLIRHEENGLLIEPRDEQLLADAMKRLMLDPELRMKMALESKKCALKYHVDQQGPKIRTLLVS